MSEVTLKAVLMGQDRSMGRTFREAGDDADRTGNKVGGLGSKFAGLAGPVGIGLGAVAAGAAAVLGVVNVTAKAASDQAETLNKSSVIFGKNADAIEKWGDTAWKKLGLSKTEAIGAAAGFGDMFQQLGFGQAKATDMSKAVVQMSADLGSFNNLPTAEVAEMISAAFRGEYDSLQRLVPNINAARVEQEALGTTGKKSAKDLTAAEKAAATLAIVQQDGARAAGDFAKTSGGLANQQKILASYFEDAKAKIGQVFLPMLTRLGQWLIEKGVPALERFGGWISDKLWPALKEGYDTIMPGVQKALDLLSGGVGDGTMSWAKFGDILTENVIPFLAKLFQVYLPAAAAQIRVVIEVVKAVWKVFTVWRDTVARVVSFILEKFSQVTSTGASMLRALSNVPGFGWAKGAAEKLQRAAEKAHSLATNVGNIPKNVPVTVTVSTVYKSIGASRFDNKGVGYSGGRAGGGPMIAGLSYLVGENGPEFVTPDRTSHVTPARQTAKALAGVGAAASSGASRGDDVFVHNVLQVDGRTLYESLVRHKRATGQPLRLLT